MSRTIDIGIDLGTTNSVISYYKEGKVQIFKNPLGWKETLPSVVAFKNDMLLVGEKAQEYLSREPQNVVARFKRKMGTDERFFIQAINQTKTPVELSAEVLKELRRFPPEQIATDAAVITIPASFDTVQANATKEAGLLAGFKQVELLQEPVAASLAYANSQQNSSLNNATWIVYDLGGGTFDTAIVKTETDEMRVVDHEGDNFLGGHDFDTAILEKLIIPYLKQRYYFHQLEKDFKSVAGRRSREWLVLLHRAEQAKIELSSLPQAEIEINMYDDNNALIEEVFTIDRLEFEALIAPYIDDTCRKMQEMINRNELKNKDIHFILLVGGATYTPFVKQRIEETLGIEAHTVADPATAIAQGAAYYAGTKQKKRETPSENTSKAPQLTVKMAYEKTSKEKSVFFIAVFSGATEELTYRITRNDGGFSTPQKPLKQRIEENLPLVENMHNFFELKVYDKEGNELITNAETIGIAQGKFSIAGQPLPNDICLEIDQPDISQTRLHVLFKKNAILPIKHSETRIVNRHIKKGSTDEFVINVLEGTEKTLPDALRTIGFMSIAGKKIKRDIVKGADIDLIFEMSESRDLKITAYIPMLDQEFSQIFVPTQRHLPVKQLVAEMKKLQEHAGKEINELARIEDYETAAQLRSYNSQLNTLLQQAEQLDEQDSTDVRYQLEDKKRKIAAGVYEIIGVNFVNKAIKEYMQEKRQCEAALKEVGEPHEKEKYNQLIEKEVELLNFENVPDIKEKALKLRVLKNQMLWRTNEFVEAIYFHLKMNRNQLPDTQRVKDLFRSGDEALQKKDYAMLRQLVNILLSLLPGRPDLESMARSTGII